MTGIVDYNAGNIRSVERALESFKAPFILSKNPKDLENCDRLIFPGVGDCAYAMQQLALTGFDSFLKDWFAAGKPMIGICLGSQIVLDSSEEGDVACLGLIKGKCRHLANAWKELGVNKDNSLKVPHMGFNNLNLKNGSTRLLDRVPENSNFYFVHSYFLQPEDDSVVKATADYGFPVPVVLEKDNLTVFQFHPEKSGAPGLQILCNFVKDDLAGTGFENKVSAATSASGTAGGASC